MYKYIVHFPSVLQEVEYQGVKFPSQLDTPFAVSQVLNQEPGKLRAKDLRDGKLENFLDTIMKFVYLLLNHEIKDS